MSGPGEFELIARFFSRPGRPARALLGIGDDCALFAPGADGAIAVSTDMLVEGRHFFPDVDPAALGHKALAVNLEADPDNRLRNALGQRRAQWLLDRIEDLFLIVDEPAPTPN